jgi:hypothetical protein
MGAIARSAANNITTSGVFTSNAITNSSVTGITVLANASDGITFISSQTASNSASISFTSGLTSTYKAYKFVFSNINPASDGVALSFQGSTDGGSNYGLTSTTSCFISYNNESGSPSAVQYSGSDDFAQSTSFLFLANGIGNGADESGSGSITLFNPSSTTYVKHFISKVQSYNFDNYSREDYVAGYLNTTSAVNAIRFQMSSGNFDGTISLYGIK